SSSKLFRDQTSNPTSSTNPTPKGCIRSSSKQKVEKSNFEENLPPEVPMADNRTMAQLIQAPIEGYKDAIVIPEIAATNFELKHGLINLVQNKQFFGHDKEDPHAHIRYFNKITTTMRVPNDSLNSAAGGNFLDKMPSDYLKIIESKSKVRQARAKAVVAKVNSNSSTPAISSDVAELKDMVRALLIDKKNQYSAPAPSPTPALIKEVEPNYVTCGGTLPGNTITNPKKDLKGITTQSGVSYQGPTIPTPSKVAKQGTEVTKDQVKTPSSQSTTPVQPLVVQSKSKTSVSEPVVAPVSAPMPNFKPSIPYPSRRDNKRRRNQANEQIEKFYEIFKDMSFEISFTDALILMPKFASTLKALIGNKEKLSEMARTSMNEHCSTVILNKSPRKLGDPEKFLIPCEFPRMDECLALADLGASINLMPLSVWKGLSLPKLTPTCMTLELVDRSVSKPIGIAKDVSVKVGVFHFPAEFVVLDFEPDPRVPLILDSPWVSPVHRVPKKGGFTVVENEENELIPTRLVTRCRVCIDYRKLNEATRKDHFFLSFMDQMLERLAGNEYYCFLDGFFGCMLAIFHVMVKKMMEVFMDNFSVFGNSFENCLSLLEKMPQRCEDTKLCLNWEKSHFMVKEGIVLGHKISKNGIEVDKAKLDVIARLPYPITIKEKLKEAPILIALNWDLPFELMCDASNFAIGAVLGERLEKHFRPIHYASKTLTDAETNYTTTKKEMLATVYAFEKFWSYLIMNKCIVHTDHSELKYLFAKKDANARLLRWVLLLQEFNFDVIDMKGAENLAADHLSRLENLYENVLDPKEINETFSLETLSMVTFRGDSCSSWFTDFANYHAGNFIVKGVAVENVERESCYYGYDL
nr:reverse transcriptase domain-containing protein [Tanacetum cinerariifolium]